MPAGADCHDVEDQHWINGYPLPVANPMSRYPRYHAYRKSWGINAMGGVVVEVEAEGGVTGVGKVWLILKAMDKRTTCTVNIQFITSHSPFMIFF